VSEELVASARAPGLYVAPGIVIPGDAEVAPHVTIYAGVTLGRRVSLQQGAILGREQQIHERSRSPVYPSDAPTAIGDHCRVGSNSVVVAGSRLGARVYISDHVLIRESVVIGEDAMIGRGCSVSHGNFVGARTRVQNDTVIGPWTVIEEDVLVSPRVTFVGDATMGRRALDDTSGGIVVRRAARIGTNAIIFPGVEIGAEAVVGAAAMVRSDVPARTVVTGAPARHLRDVREDELLEAWRPGGSSYC
jgi:acetyltransferase-like isoleucine patch superfamily enzyme